MKILLKIKYVGTDFCGYQVQPNQRTVQGELNSAAERLFGCRCNVTGCSRTDSGVHALSFYACVDSPYGKMNAVPIDRIPKALNNLLPADVSVTKAYEVNDGFHPRYDAVSKEYTYIMLNEPERDPLWSDRALHLQRTLPQDGIDRMNSACGYLIGEHDFASFMSEGSKISDTTREIYYANAEQLLSDNGERLIKFKICANGFLYNMVRIIVGTLLDVAYGKLQPEDLDLIIKEKNRSSASVTAPPHGLYLSRVDYGEGVVC